MSYDEFRRDGWTEEQFAVSMRAAYQEQRNRGVPAPQVTYREALAWHRRHHRCAALRDAS